MTEEFKGSGKVQGDFWYKGQLCQAWKDGNQITINATLLYDLDIQAGHVRQCRHSCCVADMGVCSWQVSSIRMRWGAIMGSVLSAEDAEKLFCEVSGIEYAQRRYRHDFTTEWKEFEYKPIRKDPVEWFKKHIMGMQ